MEVTLVLPHGGNGNGSMAHGGSVVNINRCIRKSSLGTKLDAFFLPEALT